MKKTRLPRPRTSPLTPMRMVWKHKVMVAVLWASVTMASLVVLYVWPDVYRSETLILVDSQKIPEQFVNATVNAELQDRLATLSQQILSSTRLQKVIDTFHLYEKYQRNHTREEVLEKMRDDIKITLEKGWAKDRPGAFRIAYHAPTPQIAADVANQLGSLFVEENLRSREVQAEGTSEFFKNQLAEARKTLDELEAKVSQYKLRHNGQLPQQEPTLIATLTRLQIELEGNQDSLNRAQQQKTMLQTAVGVAESSETALKRITYEAFNRRPNGRSGFATLSEAQRTRESAEAFLAQLRLRYRETHPDIQLAKARIEQLRQSEIDAAASKSQTDEKSEEQNLLQLSPDAQRALSQERERVMMLTSQLAAADRQVELHKKEREQILSKLSSYQAKLESLPIREQELAGVTRDYEISKAHYMSLLNKIYAVDMAADMERRQKAERFTVLDPARVPEKPMAPNRPLWGSGASLVALILSIASMVGIELRKNCVLGEWELPVSVRVLGRVPVIAPPPADGWLRSKIRSAFASSTFALFIPMILAAGLRIWTRA